MNELLAETGDSITIRPLSGLTAMSARGSCCDPSFICASSTDDILPPYSTGKEPRYSLMSLNVSVWKMEMRLNACQG